MRTPTLLLALLISFICNAQEQPKPMKLDKKKKVYEVLASCGTCNFKLKGEGCPLAIKMNDKYYWVDGTTIDEHGDAHGDDGFCNVVKKAKVQGTIEGDRFKATYFEVVKKD